MRLIHEYTVGLGRKLLGTEVHVRFVHCDKFGLGKRWGACFGRGHVLALGAGFFDYNVFVLGRKWFDEGTTENVDRLILHEFAHHRASNHLSEEYHDALCELGAKLKAAALREPEWFSQFLR